MPEFMTLTFPTRPMVSGVSSKKLHQELGLEIASIPKQLPPQINKALL